MYIVIDEFGFKREFESLKAIVIYHWRDFAYGSEYYLKLRIIDAFDHQPINIGDLIHIKDQISNERNKRFWKRRKYTFRRGPVPFTGGGNKGAYQKPIQGVKQKQVHSEHIRPASRIDLYWDEHYRDTERNWKSQRKTQWR